MTTTFAAALAFTLSNEGGYVCDPDDPGGATNRGITIATLSAWRGQAVTPEDICNLTLDETSEIYKSRYWIPLNLDLVLQEPSAIAIFDCGVLFGTEAAAKHAQAAAFAFGSTIAVDGVIGPATAVALNSIDPERFLETYRDILTVTISDIVTKRPADKKFQKGWQARIDRYPGLIAS